MLLMSILSTSFAYSPIGGPCCILYEYSERVSRKPQNSSLITYFTWIPMNPRAEMLNNLTVGMGFHCLYMYVLRDMQWEVVILILINTSTSITFRIVEMDNWLNLNKHPCWDLIRDPFASEANPRTTELSYLLKVTSMQTLKKNQSLVWQTEPAHMPMKLLYSCVLGEHKVIAYGG